MRSIISTSALAALLASGAVQAGGLDRSGQDTSIILKEGGLFEVTSISVKPTVSGTYHAGLGGTNTGDVTPDYNMSSIAMRADINDTMAIAFIQDNPYGASVNWTGGALNGTKGAINSDATTALISYGLGDAISIYGGIKSQSLSVTASVPAVSNYSLTGSQSTATGYVMGAAFEQPEIALRIALTYHSKVAHSMAISETTDAFGADRTSTISFNTPTAYNLDFQTGVAANTLLFGSVRRANWTQTSVTPTDYGLATGAAILDYDNNTTAYSIGLGRKLNDQWSIAATYNYEKAAGTDGSPFAPTDGNSAYGLGATYTADQLSVTVGARQVSIGDANVPIAVPGVGSLDNAMSGNKGLITAVKLAYKF